MIPAFDASLVFAIAIVFGAAIVRGYSGFGFSLLTISALSLLYPVKDIVPPIFMMELAASLHLLPSVWRDVHWRSLAPLIIGTLVGTPIGVWLLSTMPPAPMQLALAVFVLLSVWLLWVGYSLKRMPNTPATIGAGAAAGLANGAFGIGGPPVILFYFASPAGAVAGRASLIAYFLVIDMIGLAFLSSMTGMVTGQSVGRAVVYLPALIAGVWLGSRMFKSANTELFRRTVLVILAGLAVLIGAKALYHLSVA